MKRAYKTEIKLAQKQIQKINQSIGICRWLYNSYIAKNKELYELYKQELIPKEKAFMSANDFDKYIIDLQLLTILHLKMLVFIQIY
ncbi:MAG: helix-turn-helix domain-containing protein [Clostridium sp.]